MIDKEGHERVIYARISGSIESLNIFLGTLLAVASA